jgi:hypothetical protein
VSDYALTVNISIVSKVLNLRDSDSFHSFLMKKQRNCSFSTLSTFPSQVGHTVSKLTKTGGSLFGLFSDVQIFSRMLSNEEGAGYTNCNQRLSGDIADWNNEEDWEIVGDSEVVDVAGDTICASENSLLEHVMIIPALLTYMGKCLIIHLCMKS